ncbi:MAG TPA: hypothetical protein VGM19_00320 [Armatimonadota bacterium]|jgi:hypothetical protein
MAEQKLENHRRLIAGAAYSAWVALLMGVVLLTAAWLAALYVHDSAPELIKVWVGTTPEQFWTIVLWSVSAFKLCLWGWLLVATFLSSWWRAI